MQHSAPPTAFRRINSLPRPNSLTPTDISTVGWVTTTSSWASTRNGLASGGGVGGSSVGVHGARGGGKEQRLAWVGVRHRTGEREEGQIYGEGENSTISHCSQAVLITCLHLSHEIALREVGAYGWTIPVVKDPMGSTTKIMKQYSQQMKMLSKHSDLTCRSAPDPSKMVIQHHLQKARLGAGLHSYVVVVYNGHGIQEPPTEAGELWCYDRSFDECLTTGGGPSEYIPILLFDMLTWAGASTCYVWDCHNSGRFIRAAKTEAIEIDSQLRSAAAQNPSVADLHPAIYAKRQIHFAACSADQSLPRVEGLPDDLFTACLSAPLRIALLFHNLQTFPLTKSEAAGGLLRKSNAYMEGLWDSMSQSLKDRLWSELMTILHTIAWQTLEGPEYQKLFGRSGDLVNNLACGFLLSQRVLGAYKTTPESIPPIPSSTSHTLWTTWDLILDNLFEQLPRYFDDGKPSFSWERDLKLVSFMSDQLESITTAGQSLLFTETPRSGITPGLTRLPIICGAAMTPELRVTASTALDACLKVLDLPGLVHAVQGGALDVASKLLDLQDEKIKSQMVSIWSSLVRLDVCVQALAKEGLTAERLTVVPSVKFFLDTLQESLAKDDVPDYQAENDGHQKLSSNANIETIVQSAAVVATIANFVAGRSAPRFVLRTLRMSCVMLRSSKDLIRHWGALMTAEVLGSLDDPHDEGMVDELKTELLIMVQSPNVENRAAGVYALSRWLPPTDEWSEEELTEALDLSDHLVKNSRFEGSPMVRRELAKFVIKILQCAKRFTALSLWTRLLQRATLTRPESKDKVQRKVQSLALELRLTASQKVLLTRLNSMLKVACYHSLEPDAAVVKIISHPLKSMIMSFSDKKEDGLNRVWNDICLALFPGPGSQSTRNDLEWNEEMIDVVLAVSSKVSGMWKSSLNTGRSRFKDNDTTRGKGNKRRGKMNHDLFEKTRLALQAYLAQASRISTPSSVDTQPDAPTVNGSTWTMRHRVLEDSFVVAEEQMGLPWKWSMKDISCPDPWTNMTFHSFYSTVMSCNKDHDLFLWDWSTSRKTGSVHLNLPQGAAITSARFVNELHENVVILAEITNGDIHILSGTPDPARIKPIANFRALDIRSPVGMTGPEEDHGKLVTTWFRATGKLCVGGASDVVNVWDCPAERCVQVLETGASAAVTSLITEPVSGNLIFTGIADGTVMLFDLRQSNRSSILSWKADMPGSSLTSDDLRIFSNQKKGIAKMGVALGESKHISSACFNGLINVHDIRHLKEAASSVLAHPKGVSSASYQPHSGLMSTISSLNGLPLPSDRNWEAKDEVTKPPMTPASRFVLSHLRPRSSFKSTQAHSRPSAPVKSELQLPSADWALHRTSLGYCDPVTVETITFETQGPDVRERYIKPYTIMHPLRPFLGIGYGRTCYLRGCGIGKGDDTDSGSYSFLKSQAKLVM